MRTGQYQLLMQINRRSQDNGDAEDEGHQGARQHGDGDARAGSDSGDEHEWEAEGIRPRVPTPPNA